MPFTGPSFQKHNHGLTPAQSLHAAHIANAIMKRGQPEGLSIATANKLANREHGGMVPAEGVLQRLASLPTEHLVALAARVGPSPLGDAIRFVLHQRKRADGGSVNQGMRPPETVPILAAGGEFVIAPHHVARLGGGSVEAGHKKLDKWVVDTRQKIVDKMKSLRPPVKS